MKEKLSTWRWISVIHQQTLGAFLSEKGAGAKLQRQTLLSSGDTVYKHKDMGAFKSFSTHKIQSSKKKNKEIKHFFL